MGPGDKILNQNLRQQWVLSSPSFNLGRLLYRKGSPLQLSVITGAEGSRAGASLLVQDVPGNRPLFASWQKETLHTSFLVIVELYIREGKSLATGLELEKDSALQGLHRPRGCGPKAGATPVPRPF